MLIMPMQVPLCSILSFHPLPAAGSRNTGRQCFPPRECTLAADPYLKLRSGEQMNNTVPPPCVRWMF